MGSKTGGHYLLEEGKRESEGREAGLGGVLPCGCLPRVRVDWFSHLRPTPAGAKK